MEKVRIEHDLLGERELPAEAYWGIHTLRARENFPISSQCVPLSLIRALALVKKACCLANAELGYLDKEKEAVIVAVCDEIAAGGLVENFITDAMQGGAGTSTNMNVNEVIANRALELFGKKKGDYRYIHPLEHVNLHQSTNDTYPTALKIAAIAGCKELSQAAASLQAGLQAKEKEFSGIVTIGRTELQDAVPITLGAQFGSFAEAIARDRWRTFKCEERLRVVNLGGTAVGTGMAAPRSYIFLVIEKLREVTGFGLSRGENVMDQTANSDALVEVSGILSAMAADLSKIANDLRLLHFVEEIQLPAVQAGSSIMPGKVNPVILEAVISCGLKIRANHQLISEAASISTFQINELMPVIALSLLESIQIARSVTLRFAEFVKGITARPDVCASKANKSVSLATAFLPRIGYEAAQELIREFGQLQSKDFRDFLNLKLGKDLVDEVLSPSNLMSLGYAEKRKRN